MKIKILVFLLCSMFLISSKVMAIPVIDGIFDTTEWQGYYNSEDPTDVYNLNHYLGPGYGGQLYDVEYLGLYISSDIVYFGLQTGFNIFDGRSYIGDPPPLYDNNVVDNWFDPGDFALDIDGDSAYDYAIRFFDPNSDPEFLGSNTILFAASNWYNSDYSQHNEADPFRATDTNPSGSTLNNIASSFDGTSYTIEGSFMLSNLAGYSFGDDMTLHWTMECGNDYLNQTSAPVPEPATMLLFGTGLIGLVGISRYKFIKKRG